MASAIDVSRVKEAEECLKKAENHLKTSLLSLKFKPDYDSAASEYERAAVCFRNAKETKKCLDTYIKAADCYEKNNSMYHCAKCKESAALIYRDLGDIEKAKSLMEAASQIYAETGTPETSAQALEKVARFFEELEPDKAIKLYEKAYQIVADSDKSRHSCEYLRRITNLLLRQEKYDKAAANIEKELVIYRELKEPGKVARVTTGLVLCCLALEDSVAAAKAYHANCGIPGFDSTDDDRIIRSLIVSYEEGDVKAFQATLDRPHMRSLENELVKLTKKLRIPDDRAKSEPVASNEEKTEIDDEEEGGLC